MKATRDSFGEAVTKLGETNKNIVVLDADLSKSTKSSKFAEKFPDRFYEMGIAEANMIGTAAGLAMTGKIPFICSFGCFLTGRYDQIRMSVAYNQMPVKLIGTHCGVAIGEDGHSQMGLEDVAIVRSLPNMAIYQPADDEETKQVIAYVAGEDCPAYIRLTRQKVPNFFDSSYKFKPGKWPVVLEGKNKKVAVLATGALVGSAIEASKNLKESVTVVNCSTIKPVDLDLIQSFSEKYDILVTAEDHYTIGGLGSAVAETLSDIGSKARLVRVGVENFGESGSPEECYEHYQFDAAGMTRRLQAIAA